MKKFYSIIFILLYSFLAVAQQSNIRGQVIDDKTRETLVGVNIILNDTTGVTTDISGCYNIELNPGKYTLTYKFIGYSSEKRNVNIKSGETQIINVRMTEESKILDEVVVSAGRFEQKISDITVSMSVIRPQQIENMNTTSIEDAINYLPGVDIMDGQPSIRGGSGYSFGAGSRVMVLVDDIPLISPDAGDVKWSSIPVENISQVEVIKGASSSLFGSSALNGVINIRSAFPKNKHETKFSLSSGVYMNPKRKELIWWGNSNPMFSGANFFHSKKIGNLDVVIGAHIFNDNGYRKGENQERMRFNAKLRYRSKKFTGLSYGVNSNFMYNDKVEFIMWKDDTTGGYMQTEGSVIPMIGKRINIDPYIIYYNKKKNKHSLKTRYYFVDNTYKEDHAKDSRANMYYVQYQYQKKLWSNMHWTSGLSTTYSEINANIYGNHYSSNFAMFTQFDKKFDKLSLSFGMRAEYFKIDSSETISKMDLLISDDTLKFPVIPVVRAGASYQIKENTFLRASFGQGFRFPSIAEKYTSTNVSSLRVFPNPDLYLEKGWSAEIGVKQGIEISNWTGYLDIAGFWTEYKNMMEYVFGFYDTITYEQIDPASGKPISLGNMGFQSQNVGHAQITGIDACLTGKGRFFDIPTIIMIGYVYTNPVDLTVDKRDTTQSNMLKYRFYHSAKADMQIDYKKLSLGFSYIFSGFMVNVDEIFLKPLSGTTYIVHGYKEYREKNNKGYNVWDFRIVYKFNEDSKVSIVFKNIFNKEYMTRPTDIRPPRSLAIQYVLSL